MDICNDAKIEVIVCDLFNKLDKLFRAGMESNHFLDHDCMIQTIIGYLKLLAVENV